MDGLSTTRLGISGGVLQVEPIVSSEYSQFVVQDKPPPSYEESQQQQQQQQQRLTFRTETNEASQADKLAIYRHPLFPLLAMLFEKCEHATNSNASPSSQAFQNDIKSILLQLGQDSKSLMSGNEETDNLMIKSIMVLKIHLLEIEKVNELCKDFCQRYIACLKGKLQTDNMLRGIYTSGVEDFTCGIPNDANTQINQVQDIASLTFLSETSPIASTPTAASMKTFAEHVAPIVQSPSATAAPIPPGLMQENPDINSANVVNASFGSAPVIDSQRNGPVSGTPSESLDVTGTSISNIPRKQVRRGVLPKQATNIMKAWLFQHIAHPYPSEEEKRVIASQTNLTLLQVNNWFINARRRILQPMLDSSNPELMVRTRKAKPAGSRLVQRFWPESLVQRIQGTAGTIQFPAQAVHVISAEELKQGGLHPVAVAPATDALSPTAFRIQNVHSQKLVPVLATLPCSAQPATPATLSAIINNDGATSSAESVNASSSAIVQVACDPGCVATCSDPDLPSASAIQITASQVSTTFT